MTTIVRSEQKSRQPRKRCGLCGKTKNLIKTECCGNWICDDEHKYVMFSYARNSCHRNHRKQTLCAFHYGEGHEGDWRTCKRCRQEFKTELYVYFGTNEYNFDKLTDVPAFEPTLCTGCGERIRLGTDGYTVKPDGTYWCVSCV